MKFQSASEKKIWHITQYGQTLGPMTYAELREKCKTSANVDSDTLVWKEGMGDWQPLYKVTELSPLLDVAQPGSNTQSNLRLTGKRAYESNNDMDKDPNAAVNVYDMLQGQTHVSGKAGQNETIHGPKKWILRVLPSTVEFWVLWTVVLISSVACAIFFEYWHGIVILADAILIGFGSILLIIRAFQRGVIWGFVYLLLPFAQLIYIIVDWERAWRAVLVTFLAVGVTYLTLQDPNLKNSPIASELTKFKARFEQRIEAD